MRLIVLLLASVASLHQLVASKPCNRYTSFNAGLLRAVETNYEKRIPYIADALDKLDADLICLQEVWLESDMQEIIDSLSDKYPHHYSKIHDRQGQLRESTSHYTPPVSACSHDEINHLTGMVFPCAETKGCMPSLDMSTLLGLQCLAKRCPAELTSLGTRCLSCLALMSSGETDVYMYHRTGCSVSYSLRNRNNELNAPGLLMLSKKPMDDLQYTDYHPDSELVLTRGYLDAEVEGVGHVVCTHLSHVFPTYFEHDTKFTSFKDQQEAEITTLLEKFESVPHILLGDLNTGPPRNMKVPQENLTGEIEENYQLLIQSGYSSTYFKCDGRCTYCSHKPLVDSKANQVMDYTLVKGIEAKGLEVRWAQRNLDRVKPRPLSDHFGVHADICTKSTKRVTMWASNAMALGPHHLRTLEITFLVFFYFY